jgi:hypothetical protein
MVTRGRENIVQKINIKPCSSLLSDAIGAEETGIMKIRVDQHITTPLSTTGQLGAKQERLATSITSLPQLPL